MPDETEPYRRQRLAEINAQPGSREALEAEHGQVWTTQELSQDFDVIGFMAPLVMVRRRSDGKNGSASSTVHQPSCEVPQNRRCRSTSSLNFLVRVRGLAQKREHRQTGLFRRL